MVASRPTTPTWCTFGPSPKFPARRSTDPKAAVRHIRAPRLGRREPPFYNEVAIPGGLLMEVREAIRLKRAVREFDPRPLSDEAVGRILGAGRRAQSSENTQPWHFIAVRDRATLQALP